jgi:hypothetical protein
MREKGGRRSTSKGDVTTKEIKGRANIRKEPFSVESQQASFASKLRWIANLC